MTRQKLRPEILIINSSLLLWLLLESISWCGRQGEISLLFVLLLLLFHKWNKMMVNLESHTYSRCEKEDEL